FAAEHVGSWNSASVISSIGGNFRTVQPLVRLCRTGLAAIISRARSPGSGANVGTNTGSNIGRVAGRSSAKGPRPCARRPGWCRSFFSRPAPRRPAPCGQGLYRISHHPLRIKNQRHRAVAEDGGPGDEVDVPVKAPEIFDHCLMIAEHLIDDEAVASIFGLGHHDLFTLKLLDREVEVFPQP